MVESVPGRDAATAVGHDLDAPIVLHQLHLSVTTRERPPDAVVLSQEPIDVQAHPYPSHVALAVAAISLDDGHRVSGVFQREGAHQSRQRPSDLSLTGQQIATHKMPALTHHHHVQREFSGLHLVHSLQKFHLALTETCVVGGSIRACVLHSSPAPSDGTLSLFM